MIAPNGDRYGVRAAEPRRDRTVVNHTFTAAFLTVAQYRRWLLPTPPNPPNAADPIEVVQDYFALRVDHAFRHGLVEVTKGCGAAALWYDHTAGTGIPDDGHQLPDTTSPYQVRFAALHAALAKHDPDPARAPHVHLALLATHPDVQEHGHGTRLLAHRHTTLDAQDRASFVESTGPSNRRLFEKAGYEPREPGYPRYSITDEAGAPVLAPMWRTPSLSVSPQRAGPV